MGEDVNDSHLDFPSGKAGSATCLNPLQFLRHLPS